MPDRLQLDMRQVGHFVGRHDAIDDGRARGLERLLDGGVQFAGLGRPKALAAAGVRQRGEIRVGKFDAFPIGSKPAATSAEPQPA